jgi:uncharacterized protein YaiL (DUF2058 family)
MSEKERIGVERGVVQLADDAYCDDKQNGDLQRNEQHNTVHCLFAENKMPLHYKDEPFSSVKGNSIRILCVDRTTSYRC